MVGGRFLVGFTLWEAKGGVPPLKKIKIFGKIFSQRIDRKSQKISATLASPFGRDKCSKKVWVNLTPPPCVIGLRGLEGIHSLSKSQLHIFLQGALDVVVFCSWIKLHHDNEILFNLINYQIELFDCTHSSIKVIRWINTLLNMFHANHIWNIKYFPQTYQGQSKHKLTSDGLGRALPSLILSFLFLPMNTSDNWEPCWASLL